MSPEIIDGRTKRAINNKKAILKAARDIFIKNGFKKNSMVEISRRAGVGYGTLYTHFSGMDDILRHLLKEIAEDFDQVINHPYEPDSIFEVEKRLRDEIFYLLTLARKHSNILKVAYQAKGQSKYIEEYCELIVLRYIEKSLIDYSYSLQKGLARPGLKKNYVAKALIYIITEFFWDVVLEKEDDIEDLSQNITCFYMYGVYFNNK